MAANYSVLSAVTYAQQLGQTDSNGIGSVLGLAFYNDALQDVTRDLIYRGIDAAQTIEDYATISASDSQPGRFPWPSSMYALKTIEVDYTNTGGDSYLQAHKLDVANLQGDTSWDYVRVNQPTNKPMFTNHGDTGEIFPTPVAGSPALVRIYSYIRPQEATSVNDTINYPNTLDYRMLSLKMVAMYYKRLERPDQAEVFEKEYQARLNKTGTILAPQSKQPIQPEKLRITGWNL